MSSPSVLLRAVKYTSSSELSSLQLSSSLADADAALCFVIDVLSRPCFEVPLAPDTSIGDVTVIGRDKAEGDVAWDEAASCCRCCCLTISIVIVFLIFSNSLLEFSISVSNDDSCINVPVATLPKSLAHVTNVGPNGTITRAFALYVGERIAEIADRAKGMARVNSMESASDRTIETFAAYLTFSAARAAAAASTSTTVTLVVVTFDVDVSACFVISFETNERAPAHADTEGGADDDKETSCMRRKAVLIADSPDRTTLSSMVATGH